MENGLSFLNSYGYVMYWCKKKLIAGASQGVMPFRPVNEAAVKDWQSLGAIFERILGGSETSQGAAAAYLRNRSNNTLPDDEGLLPLTWHEADFQADVVLQQQELPHPCVLAVLAPSANLRAVWRRGR